MSKRIYVGNLPWSVTKTGLEELFSPFGEIEEALVIANKYTGRSRGFGFVTYKNDADADKAMEEMNEKEIEGRNLVVKLARPSREIQEEAKTEEGPKEEQKPKEKEQEPLEKKTRPKEVELKKPHIKEVELKKTRPDEAELKKKPEKKPKRERPAEKKEKTEEEQ